MSKVRVSKVVGGDGTGGGGQVRVLVHESLFSTYIFQPLGVNVKCCVFFVVVVVTS